MNWQTKLAIGSLLVVVLSSVFAIALPSLLGMLISALVLVAIADFVGRRRRHAYRTFNSVLQSVCDQEGAVGKVAMAFARTGPIRASCYELARRLTVGQEPIDAATQSGIPLQLGTAVAMTTASARIEQSQDSDSNTFGELVDEDSSAAYSQILYVTIVVLATCCVLWYMTLYVMPDIKTMLQEFELKETPYEWLVVGVTPSWLILGVIVSILIFLAPILTKGGMIAVGPWKWMPASPVVAESKADMLCGLADAIDQGLPLEQALGLASRISVNHHEQATLQQASQLLQSGATPGESLFKSGWVDQQQHEWLIAAPPQRFAELLRQFASQGVRDAQSNLRWLMGIVFPLFVVALGTAVLAYAYGILGSLTQLIHHLAAEGGLS